MLWHSLLTCSVSFGQNGKSNLPRAATTTPTIQAFYYRYTAHMSYEGNKPRRRPRCGKPVPRILASGRHTQTVTHVGSSRLQLRVDTQPPSAPHASSPPTSPTDGPQSGAGAAPAAHAVARNPRPPPPRTRGVSGARKHSRTRPHTRARPRTTGARYTSVGGGVARCTSSVIVAPFAGRAEVNVRAKSAVT